MIVTLTANPSIDRTVILDGRLQRGEVVRASAATVQAGGKGVNVARALSGAGTATLAVLPSPPDDPILAALTSIGLPHRAVPTENRVRTNLTLSESDGTTTKVNEPGPLLSSDTVAALVQAITEAAVDASWVVLAGSLPPEVDPGLYSVIVSRLADLDCQVAVDTSGGPLRALFEDRGHPPDLIKPNAEELADVVGGDPTAFEADASLAARAASELVARGVGTVLLTLGAKGAVLVDRTGTWLATAPQVEARSTVGAGDSALAGWLLADLAGHDSPTRLRWATAWGAAAVTLPGTTLPTPELVQPEAVAVREQTIAAPT